MEKPKLIIFDFDGTILHNPDFYKNIYSKSLDKLISKKRGDTGLEVLQNCRKNFNEKGELALLALNIPFKQWAEILIGSSLEGIDPEPELVEQIKKINAIKVIYSGSPVEMVKRVLRKIGFSIDDFNLIVGWQEPEIFPVKWTCSPIIFEKITRQFDCTPEQTLAVGDDWNVDLLPAKTLGIKTAQIQKHGGDPDFYFDNINEFIKSFSN